MVEVVDRPPIRQREGRAMARDRDESVEAGDREVCQPPPDGVSLPPYRSPDLPKVTGCLDRPSRLRGPHEGTRISRREPQIVELPTTSRFQG